MEYLIILSIVLAVTIFIDFKYNLKLFLSPKQGRLLVFIFFIVGVVWDSFAIWRGHWIFPDTKTIGIKIGLMPLEEYLFIFIIPYFIITVYKLTEKYFKKMSKV